MTVTTGEAETTDHSKWNLTRRELLGLGLATGTAFFLGTDVRLWYRIVKELKPNDIDTTGGSDQVARVEKVGAATEFRSVNMGYRRSANFESSSAFWNKEIVDEFTSDMKLAGHSLSYFFGQNSEDKEITLRLEKKGDKKYPSFVGEWFMDSDGVYHIAKDYKGMPRNWVTASILSHSWDYPNISIDGWPASFAEINSRDSKIIFPPGQYFNLNGLNKYESLMAKAVELNRNGQIFVDGDASVVGNILRRKPDFFVRLKALHQEAGFPEVISYDQWMEWIEQISPSVYEYWLRTIRYDEQS